MNSLPVFLDFHIQAMYLDEKLEKINGEDKYVCIFEESLEEILEKEKTKKIIDGFKNRIAVEDLCKNCTYKNRF